MSKISIALFTALLMSASGAAAQVYVEGYFKSDGTYVQPHFRSAPNNTTTDNWSTKGNVNPYTGQQGNRNPYQPPRVPQYTPPAPTYPTYVPTLPVPQVQPYAPAYPKPCRYKVINGILVCGS